jgi:hypothetical protein
MGIPPPRWKLQLFLESDMRTLLMIGLAGLIIMVLTPQVPAQDLNRVLHAITDPHDAQRYEEQAHRGGRPDEERYWHQYGAGLQTQRYDEQARRSEERAHKAGRPDEERYWHEYRAGLQAPR